MGICRRMGYPSNHCVRVIWIEDRLKEWVASTFRKHKANVPFSVYNKSWSLEYVVGKEFWGTWVLETHINELQATKQFVSLPIKRYDNFKHLSSRVKEPKDEKCFKKWNMEYTSLFGFTSISQMEKWAFTWPYKLCSTVTWTALLRNYQRRVVNVTHASVVNL